ncbi:MAG: glycosyltransferase [Pyrinomonadaceae bacterium]
MNLDSPLVSVITPVYNAGKYLAATIESVLAETYGNTEYIVINDGSTDDSAEIARSFGDRIIFIDKPNGGVASARNTGVAAAKGEYIAFLDADDLWLPEKIERQMPAFETGDNVGMVFCGVAFIDQNGNAQGGGDGVVSHKQLIRNILLMTGTTGYVSSTGVFDKRVFDDVGGFDSDLSTSADADFICRLSTRYGITAVDEPLAMYRVHGAQMHHNLAALEHDMNIVLGKLYASDDLATEVAELRAKAYSSLESTLAIGFLIKGKFGIGLSHLATAARYDLGTPIHHMSKLVKSRFK